MLILDFYYLSCVMWRQGQCNVIFETLGVNLVWKFVDSGVGLQCSG